MDESCWRDTRRVAMLTNTLSNCRLATAARIGTAMPDPI